MDIDALFDEPRVESDLDMLMRHWMNERHAPALLPSEDKLLGRLLDRIRRQTDTVQALRGDPSSSEEEHIRIMLVQTEVERVKFVVRSYIRTRLFKIEKFARFIAIDEDTQSLLTTAERKFAIELAKNTDQHFMSTVLQSLPEDQRHIDDTHAFEPEMATKPDRNRAVFAFALKDCPPVLLPEGRQMSFRKDQLSLVPFHVVEHLVNEHVIQLV
ncbi:GINS complex, Sld5 component [Cylindrobasidium torrendii FP15055 ss-10]|uniref:DNA replication complex GINS protein SLD5 n=1 Tax=Cylindrobasidium torrendii FP15055 ss-10 TaxID=1314674 RepID=A0A0D7AXP1_9AGAR|nr:GINS complex, Sld5 component [Cylindrobasidium torrendii FP15055 ss-10]